RRAPATWRERGALLDAQWSACAAEAPRRVRQGTLEVARRARVAARDGEETDRAQSPSRPTRRLPERRRDYTQPPATPVLRVIRRAEPRKCRQPPLQLSPRVLPECCCPPIRVVQSIG